MPIPTNPNMRTYARVADNTIVELLTTDSDISAAFHPGLVWIDVTGVAGAAVGWTVSANGVASAPVLPTPTSQQLLVSLDGALAAAEAVGVYFQPASLPSPAIFPTDLASQPRMTAAYVAAQAGLWADGTFFRDINGRPVALTSAEVQALAQKAATYILNCGNHAASLAGQIEAGHPVDLTAGWPDSA